MAYIVINFLVIQIAGITAFVATKGLSEDKCCLVWNVKQWVLGGEAHVT